MIQGRLCIADEGFENLLGVLLELVGADCTVRLGSASVWRAAVAKLPD